MTGSALCRRERTDICVITGDPVLRRGFGRRRSGDLIFQYFTQAWRIKPGKGEHASVTGAVRAEGCVTRTARVLSGVALRASLIHRLVVQADPVGVEVRVRLDAAAVDFDGSHQILRARNNGDGMAKITLKADRLLLRVQMRSIVTAETPGRVDMP